MKLILAIAFCLFALCAIAIGQGPPKITQVNIAELLRQKPHLKELAKQNLQKAKQTPNAQPAEVVTNARQPRPVVSPKPTPPKPVVSPKATAPKPAEIQTPVIPKNVETAETGTKQQRAKPKRPRHRLARPIGKQTPTNQEEQQPSEQETPIVAEQATPEKTVSNARKFPGRRQRS